jgi:hypothetical protein
MSCAAQLAGAGAGRLAVRRATSRDWIAFSFLFRDPIIIYFSVKDAIAFYFLSRNSIAISFSIEGPLCKYFDSQVRQAAKQHLSAAYLSKPGLPNMRENLKLACLKAACMRGDSNSKLIQATKHTLTEQDWLSSFSGK